MIYRNEDDPTAGGGEAVLEAPKADAPAAKVDAPKPDAAKTETKPDAKLDAKGYWPEDWRQTVSKADEKVLGRLQRYASPDRISAGELKPVLGKDATADEIKAWRTEHGIPETPDKYDLKDAKVEGIPQDLLTEVFNEAHASNQTPEQVKATIKAWNKISNTVSEKRVEADLKFQKDGEDALRAEWGGEFRRNINLVHGLLDGAGSEGLKESLLSARLPNGQPIGSSPEVLKMLVSLALIQNPTGVVVPGGDGNQAKGIDDEIAGIEKTMRENRSQYNKDERMQARYRDLLGAREQMKPRK
jgi:hypothetical protein